MQPAYFVVVCNSTGGSLSHYAMSAEGKLAELGEQPLPGVGAPNGACPMTVSEDRQRLYLAFRGQPDEILSFGVDPAQRSLVLLGRAPLAESMAHIALSSDGRFLLSASYGGGCVSMNPVGSDGVVGAPTDTLATAGKMHCCVPLPGSNAFLATSLEDSVILTLRVSDAGKLSQIPSRSVAAPGSGPRHLVLHPSGRFCYLVTEFAATVSVYSLDGEGLSPQALCTASTLPPHWQREGWGADIRLTPDGRFCYASDRTSSTIAGFSVHANGGVLRSIGYTNVACWPRAFNITPDGRFIISLGEMSDRIEVFSIDQSNGSLDKRDAVATGKGPNWVEIFAT
ncbi:lactonase family protein [Devosia naphthalenivorans]|uniref:lactonase family protein n=1 Tax=Devosia naphthalenivorans TaxID=2082392 RepID=UPI000D370CBF|nr:beta-propeller fold lactonase family protein [Devosia naphthalenivorans]